MFDWKKDYARVAKTPVSSSQPVVESVVFLYLRVVDLHSWAVCLWSGCFINDDHGARRLSSPLLCSVFKSCLSLTLHANLVSFRTVVFVCLPEPRMFEGLLGSDTLLWVIDEYPLEKIEEQSIECVVRWDNVVEMLHRLDEFLR